MQYLGRAEIGAYSRAQAAMDLPAWLAVALELGEGYPNQWCISRAGGRYPLTAHNYAPQAGHTNFHQARQGNKCSLSLLTKAENTSFWVYPWNHKFVHCPETDRKKLEGGLKSCQLDSYKLGFPETWSSSARLWQMEARARTAISHSYHTVSRGLEECGCVFKRCSYWLQ